MIVHFTNDMFLDNGGVIVMRVNNYVNATKLCQRYNKRFDLWLRCSSNKRLIYDFHTSYGYEKKLFINKAMILVTNIDPDLCGIYIHPAFVPYIMSWIHKRNWCYIWVIAIVFMMCICLNIQKLVSY